ncbi:Yip1 domain-containing protein [Jimgerdemannia flammicorona]|uniref:Protein YIP n=1 Tax=Jimgerdemannia flammicorona TaxID=994334 RepID=A0A432ZY95_9FUNG|nr:Yip1 domain-containing protein [Jimgerdemannia flammicorona]
MSAQYDNPFANPAASSVTEPLFSASASIEADDDILPSSVASSAAPKAKQPASPKPSVSLSGNIGSSTSTNPVNGNGAGLGTGATRAYKEDTLDEPVSVTTMRDLRNVAEKLQQVMIPNGRKDVLKDWDLWGPLFLCLSLAIVLSFEASKNSDSEGQKQTILVFTSVFVIVWVGSAVVTLNAKLLGGTISFFQCVCVLGYCLFPLVVAAIVNLITSSLFIRLPLEIAAFGWASYASVGFLAEVHLSNRRALAVYPLFLFYFIIAWMVLIS